MHPAIKIVIGLLLIVVSIYYIVNGIPGYLAPGWPALLTVLKGVIPLLLLMLGVFIVWLEWDELRIEKELKTEEEKPAKKKSKK
ncbi:MAG: hypothetical protein NZ942_03535 [Candidatus Aenigmarchaeota archaeon]|nr:hypothetical protein [Candidatus Aenigmarchaeota archaeon]